MVNIKDGLDYFPLDTNIELDDKMALIEAKHGHLGFYVIIKLIIKIYGDKGYYYDWNEKTQLIFSRRINVDYKQVKEIVEDAINFELFNKDRFKKYGILTSKRIQIQFLEATKRRKNVEMKRAYLVLNGQSDNILRDNVNILNDNDDILKQKKVNEIKGKEKDYITHIEFVNLTEKELKELNDKLGSTKTTDMIERLNGYIGQIGTAAASKKYKSHYHTILNWHRMDGKKEPDKPRKRYEEVV